MKLSRNFIDKAWEYVRRNCRGLEVALFEYHFGDGSVKAVIDELRKFQNGDGGFGKGLEPDFWLPDSSPLATSMAFQIMDELDGIGVDESLVKAGILYFEDTFITDRGGWKTVGERVNDYGHAPWWEYLEDEEGTVIDRSWGNPTAEIVGYLFKYRNYVKKLDVDGLVENAIGNLISKEVFESEHEVYCYIRLVDKLPEKIAVGAREKLAQAVRQLVVGDKERWGSYVPKPLDFVSSPNHYLYSVVAEMIDDNLDYLIESVGDDGVWSPSWSWGVASEEWERARRYWQGILAVRNLLLLRSFGRLDV